MNIRLIMRSPGPLSHGLRRLGSANRDRTGIKFPILCSVERALTRHEMGDILGTAFHRKIVAGRRPIEEALQAERFRHYTKDQLEQMSAVYNFFDLNGTPGFNSIIARLR